METYRNSTEYGLRTLSAALATAALLSVGASGCAADTGEDNGNAANPAGDEKEASLGEATQPISYDGHDYLFFLTPRSWASARASCQKNGYDLVTINSLGEEAFLDAEEYKHGNGLWWIGYTDQAYEGMWVWVDGTSGHTYWADGEPNNAGNEDCAIDNWYGERWNDGVCSNPLPFICERNYVPTTSSRTYTYVAEKTDNATQNTYNYAVNLYAGQTITVGTCGLPNAWTHYLYPDTYLRLTTLSGTEIASNDDACGGFGSNFSAVIPTDGTYMIRSGCYSANYCQAIVSMNIR
jgi:hypothetical protein